MFSWLFNKVKNYGVGHAIQALDNLEKPLGDRIQESLDKFHKLDGHGIAILMIDEIQSLLKAYFNIKEPPKEK